MFTYGNDDGAEHDHVYGPVESSHFAGTFHRKCQVTGCRFISLDLSDDDESDDDES